VLAGFLNLRHDRQSRFQGIPPHLAGYQGGATVLNGLHKGFDFIIQRIAFIKAQFLDCHTGNDTIRLTQIRMNKGNFIVGKVDGNVGIFLKKPEFSFILGRYSAGCYIGDGPVCKLQTGVGDIYIS